MPVFGGQTESKGEMLSVKGSYGMPLARMGPCRPQAANCLRSPPAEGRSSIDQAAGVAPARGRLLSRVHPD
jgi:hypothetical protein